jgi:hypothetical protein
MCDLAIRQRRMRMFRSILMIWHSQAADFNLHSPGARRAGRLPLKTRSFLDHCVPRLHASLADLLPADAAALPVI